MLRKGLEVVPLAASYKLDSATNIEPAAASGAFVVWPSVCVATMGELVPVSAQSLALVVAAGKDPEQAQAEQEKRIQQVSSLMRACCFSRSVATRFAWSSLWAVALLQELPRHTHVQCSAHACRRKSWRPS